MSDGQGNVGSAMSPSGAALYGATDGDMNLGADQRWVVS
jgi:hypothetical protein